SLTGSSGEDFASILRALGYRMEKRPKPPEPPPAPPAIAADAAAAATAPPIAEASGGAVRMPPPAEFSAQAPVPPTDGPTVETVEEEAHSGAGAMPEAPAMAEDEAAEAVAEAQAPPAESTPPAEEQAALGAVSSETAGDAVELVAPAATSESPSL